ncbi:hypothetical protein Micbo1qcDRAFT_179171 [Microdochium bolleyi]|uniref:Uncharacterized protein n=1 Tax=Microdochium bolleyi TaxID=196109 RepID=A0A136IRG3_9PEZI|nr:hypothetical protein Micbo1qcDRAFT_179171 [Microdochium bolleyi]
MAPKAIAMTLAGLPARPASPRSSESSSHRRQHVERRYGGGGVPPAPYEPERYLQSYGASKTLSKRKALDPVAQGCPSTAGMLAALYNGDTGPVAMLGPGYFIDVRDTARLHVAAAVLPGVKSERIFGFADTFNGNLLLLILRKLYLDMTFPDASLGGQDLSDIVPRARAEQLLRIWAGTDGRVWKRLCRPTPRVLIEGEWELVGQGSTNKAGRMSVQREGQTS